MVHCVGLVTKSDIGTLSFRYRDSELPEDKEAERLIAWQSCKPSEHLYIIVKTHVKSYKSNYEGLCDNR